MNFLLQNFLGNAPPLQIHIIREHPRGLAILQQHKTKKEMAATSPLLNQNGYCVPPQQGGYYPSGYGPPQAYRPDAAPWYHPNIPSNHYFAPTGMPAPLFPHWQPPMRGRGSRPWRGGKGRGRWSGGSTVLLECKPCSKQYKSREAYDTHIQSHVKVQTHTYAML